MRRCHTDLVVKAYVNEVPVLQARCVQDGAEVTVQLLAADQVVVRRPAPTAEHTGKRVSPAAPPPRQARGPELTTSSTASGSHTAAFTISGHTSY